VRVGDARIIASAEVEDWIGRRLKRDPELLLVPKEKPGMFDFLMRGTFAHAVPHRLSPAPVPDKAQMVNTIRQASPGTAWLLYLDLAGHFRMLDTAQDRIIGNAGIAVRGEIASGTGYVGKKAASADTIMDQTYCQFLAGWLEHLTTRRLGVFIPDAEKLEPEEAIKQKICDWQHE
jgi:hypothetical protein